MDKIHIETDNKRLNCISVQNFPKLSKIDDNISEVNNMLKVHEGKSIDIIVLPEMAFTGYKLKDEDMLKQLAEKQTKGLNFQAMKEIALKFNCYVFGGYPEKADEGYYNSMYCIDRKGALLLNYRKLFLYDFDKPYYLKGDGFKTCDIITLKGDTLKVAMCICMDLNPEDFGDFYEFEFSTFVRKEQADIIIFSSNWLVGSNDDSILNYWLIRMAPLINNKNLKANFNLSKEDYKNCIFLCANRTGYEDETRYIGSSCHISLNPINLHKMCDRMDEAAIFSSIPY